MSKRDAEDWKKMYLEELDKRICRDAEIAGLVKAVETWRKRVQVLERNVRKEVVE